MLRNWLLTALRNFRKNKTSSAINIFGLTMGLSSCLLIALYIRHELSYDDFEVKGPRIVRSIMGYRFDGGGEMRYGNFNSTKVATTFKRVFPEIESGVRMAERPRIVSYQEKLFTEDRFMFADSSFFLVFSMPLTKGDANTALSGPKKVVLTESTARKYFGSVEPVGKLLRIGNDSVDYLVTGLMKDCPSNSQFKFDLLASFSSLYSNQDETYWDANYGTFFLLHERTSLPALQTKVTAFMKKEMAGKGAEVNFLLEPFMRVHLYSEYEGFEPGTSITYIYILAGVALLILVIACSTYINLSTARSVDRAREVGVRKVIGAGRGQLFWQFIGESLLLCLIAVLLSLGVVLLVLPAFNHLADRQLPWSGALSPVFLGLALLMAIVVALLAGGYPALVLSRFQPVKVLKGAFKNTHSGQRLRQSLIVGQFVISVFLIISTFIMGRQLSFIRSKKLGYDRDHVVELPMNRRLLGQLDYLKAEFRRNPDVLSLSTCASSPVQIQGGYNMRNDIMPASQQMSVYGNPVDEDYIATTGLQLVAGQGLTKQDLKDAHPADQAVPDTVTKPMYHFILNEKAARELGWSPQEAIGKRMYMDESRPGYVKGVVKDFNFESLHNPIKGLVLFPAHRADRLLVRVTGQHMAETLDFLQATWKRLAPGIPYELRFLDENYKRMYASEQRLGTVMNLFSGIAIALACLGLFGLSSYAAKQRVKEIGIRKVLGASLGNLVVLLTASFIWLAGIAILIAVPLAWWAMTRWLQDFIYRVEIEWWVGLGAALLVLLITLLTVSIEAVKTARLNPAKNLKVE